MIGARVAGTRGLSGQVILQSRASVGGQWQGRLVTWQSGGNVAAERSRDGLWR